eukprot:s463_g29.t1
MRRPGKALTGKTSKICLCLCFGILALLTKIDQTDQTTWVPNVPNLQPDGVSRRRSLLLLSSVGISKPAEALVSSTLSPAIEEVVNVEPKGTDFQTLPGGLRILDLAVGKGHECCKEDDLVVVDWSLRKSNGYFVDASFGFDPGRGIDEKFGVGSPELRFSPIGKKGDKVIEGVKKAMIGMRVGGTRRVIVPPNLGYVSDDLAPKPVDWGRQTQIQRAKNKNFVIELRLKTLRQE